MRTLLIDNYDSYTYNLFQLIAEVNAAEPVVISNDADARVDFAAFDNIVVSPGPGHPGRPGDFGLCADVIARTTIPLLGVCLGHQGIVTGADGVVDRAPRARHGHLTTVRHDEDGMFRGLPQGFTAVRYHSLCAVDPLPPELVATAWAEDGVLMGVRHRERPLFGLQFHPESVATEYGRELLANFRDITRARRGGSATLVSPGELPGPQSAAPGTVPAGPVRDAAQASRAFGRDERAPARTDPVRYRLRVRELDAAVHTEAAFTELFTSSDTAFWLDSAYVEPGLSRFSFLGDGSGPLGELVRYRVGDGHVSVSGQGRPARRVPGTIFDYLRTELAARDVDAPALPFDFTGGYVGYFGYELKADCGSRNAYRSPYPDAQWIFADRFVAVDHAAGRTYALTLDEGSPAGIRDAEAWLAATAGVLSRLPGDEPVRRRSATSDISLIEPWLVRDRARYEADIRACKQKLIDGESYEICLTEAARIPAAGGGYAFYQELRRCNPAPYGAYLRFGETHIACSSPERFLKIDRTGTVEAKPIKGTARRGTTPAEDRALREELATSAKTYAENLMIVDLLRNDLGRICEVSSVHVPKLMEVESYATVHQLVSTVRGRLRPEVGPVECVRACFPGGSMTGAPKLRTMEIIDSLETEARGVYSGTIGFLGCAGTADLNIVIRTAVLADGEWHVGAGGAIVLDSDPSEEYEEMLLKAAATLRAHAKIGDVPGDGGLAAG